MEITIKIHWHWVKVITNTFSLLDMKQIISLRNVNLNTLYSYTTKLDGFVWDPHISEMLSQCVWIYNEMLIARQLVNTANNCTSLY